MRTTMCSAGLVATGAMVCWNMLKTGSPTSTSSDENAYFVTQGSISFSNYFWTHIFNGLDIKEAFEL